MINVTKTFLPPQDEYQAILKRAWLNGWITNRGELVKELEDKLKRHLNTPNIICMTNGTLPIQIAIKALALKGEIITTPFSYVATTSSIVWEGCKPVFVDIHPEYLTIDETKIEAAITERTSAILATHVFGNPCNVDAIKAIALKYNLKVIYDAAHCFGVTYNGKSIFQYGDINTCSFHATKLFHTGEGGAIIFKDKDLYNDLYYHHNFGHDGQENFFGLGINAKMSELQAAMGLAVFPYLSSILENRKRIVDFYNEQLYDTGLKFLKLRDKTHWNYSYYPVIFQNEAQLLKAVKALNSENIFPRRYFYPSLDNLPYIKNQYCEISNTIAASILCLPLYDDLTEKEQINIIELIKTNV
ncbi:MAG: DegT/DnrJ/EryC1/StrS family aminotransferase [Winogradskyella sp.]|uniref:DegT/DnrJ/EryC1/StrS family aminotransferase n=1 Tax=Winogradskyella sp. TaxID=1883156 RepID=UPI000F40944E|nr:DegT/DnrJ/EryC1/StrS family aminotransferase [Winogradskyella sp.]RNC86874.1 MAG: DegT/DnrJ/EryC1/StrS family aminotransferase [Winogradskyella sp.]